MIKLTCKSCGAKLKISNIDIGHFNCAHCGTEWLLEKSGGIISLVAVEENIKEIDSNTRNISDHTEYLANDLRAQKIRKRIKELESRKAALIRNEPGYEPCASLVFYNSEFFKFLILAISSVFYVIMLHTDLDFLTKSRASAVQIYILFIVFMGVLFFLFFVYQNFVNEIRNKDLEKYQEKLLQYHAGIENDCKAIDSEIERLKDLLYDIEDKMRM